MRLTHFLRSAVLIVGLALGALHNGGRERISTSLAASERASSASRLSTRTSIR
jgi:hypothetical protein